MRTNARVAVLRQVKRNDGSFGYEAQAQNVPLIIVPLGDFASLIEGETVGGGEPYSIISTSETDIRKNDIIKDVQTQQTYSVRSVKTTRMNGNVLFRGIAWKK